MKTDIINVSIAMEFCVKRTGSRNLSNGLNESHAENFSKLFMDLSIVTPEAWTTGLITLSFVTSFSCSPTTWAWVIFNRAIISTLLAVTPGSLSSILTGLLKCNILFKVLSRRIELRNIYHLISSRENCDSLLTLFSSSPILLKQKAP